MSCLRNRKTKVLFRYSNLPPSRRAMRHARALGQRKARARARQAATARPAIAHAASLAHVPLLPGAMCGRRAMAHTRAAAAAPATGDFRRPHRSSRTPGAVRSAANSRGFRREKNVLPTSVRVRGQDHARTSGSFLKRHFPLSNGGSPIEADPDCGRWTFGPPRPHAVAREQPPSLS